MIDDFAAGDSSTRYTLESGGEEIPLRPTTLKAEPGDRVVFSGELRDGRLVGTVRATASGTETEAALLAPRKVAVLLFRFPGDPAVPWSPEVTRSKVFTATTSANAFFKEESYGNISLTGKLGSNGDVFGWLNVTGPTAGCPHNTWDQEANEAAADAGIDLSGYQHVIYVHPSKSGCGYLGIADVTGTHVDINGNVNSMVIAHELGHNLGLQHANSLTCTSGNKRVTIGGTCTSTEYGDPFDTMGNIAYRHNNGSYLEELGILKPENVQTVTSSGTYALRSALALTTQPTLLRVPFELGPGGSVLASFDLEIRETGGVFENVTDTTTTGVSVRIPEVFGSSQLLDGNPSTAGFGDAPLKPGQTLDAGFVRITILTAGAGQASVQVEIDSEPPAVPDQMQASVDADGAHLSWVSSDDFGIDRYVVFRDGEQIGEVEDPSFLDTRVPAGSHDYTVVARDLIGNESEPSDPLTVAVPVVSGPTCAAGKCRFAFRYSGGPPATWTVPPGVHAASLTVEGAGGGGSLGNAGPERPGGPGARIWATLDPLTPGQVAAVSAGGHGEPFSEGGAGGFNGGGDGGRGGGGGGYTTVKLDSTLEVLASGGGGGGIDSVGGNRLAKGGNGGAGGIGGSSGGSGGQIQSEGATLTGGEGGEPGGLGGLPGEAGEVQGASSCAGGAENGVFGAPGASLSGGGGIDDAGGGGGGGYVGGSQGGSGAHDECGARAASGGGAGGSSFVAPGRLVGSETSGRGDGWVSIEYDNPLVLQAHSYLTFENEELDVPVAKGVLAGGSVAAGVSATLSVADPPDHGSLTLKDDGSFTYVPDPAYLGTDSFKVRLADPAGHYAEATAALNIAGPPAALISSPQPGGTYVVGQSVATAFSCSEGPGGTGLTSCNDSSGTASKKGGSGHLDTSTLGDHTYTVKAVSTDGLEDTESIEYEVVAPPEPPKPPEPHPGATEPVALTHPGAADHATVCHSRQSGTNVVGFPLRRWPRKPASTGNSSSFGSANAAGSAPPLLLPSRRWLRSLDRRA